MIFPALSLPCADRSFVATRHAKRYLGRYAKRYLKMKRSKNEIHPKKKSTGDNHEFGN